MVVTPSPAVPRECNRPAVIGGENGHVHPISRLLLAIFTYMDWRPCLSRVVTAAYWRIHGSKHVCELYLSNSKISLLPCPLLRLPSSLPSLARFVLILARNAITGIERDREDQIDKLERALKKYHRARNAAKSNVQRVGGKSVKSGSTEGIFLGLNSFTLNLDQIPKDTSYLTSSINEQTSGWMRQ